MRLSRSSLPMDASPNSGEYFTALILSLKLYAFIFKVVRFVNVYMISSCHMMLVKRIILIVISLFYLLFLITHDTTELL